MTDWTALETAEGSATSVPRWIAELSAESLPQRDEALLSLFARLVRDGVTYSAAPAALDALAPLSDAFGEHGHRSLWLVGDIFAAGHLARIRGVSPEPSPARQAVLERGEAWRAIAEKAARQPDEAWRAAAAFALAFVPGKVHALVLELARNDPSIPVRVCASFACGWLARSHDAMVRALEATPEDERLADAVWIARAIAAPERTSEATEALVRWLLTPCSQELAPWGRRATQFADAVVSGYARPAELAPALARAIRDTPPGSMRAKRSALLEWVLRLSGVEGIDERKVLPPDELPSAAVAVAKELAVASDLPPTGFGLPGNAYAIRRWLGLEEPGLLEQPPGDPRWRQAYRFIPQDGSFDVVKEMLFVGLSPIDRLRLATELLRGSYGILSNGSGRLDARELDAWATDAGEEARAWAVELLGLADAAGDIGDYTKMAHIARGHLTVAILVLHRFGGQVDPAWVDFVSLPDVDLARRALEAFAPAERQGAALRRFTRCNDETGRGLIIKEVVPLWELLGSPELLEELRTTLTQPRVARTIGKKAKAELEKLLA